jgi:hypothetical protein
MKIIIEGTIIDTEQIYTITPVIGDNHWFYTSLSVLNHSGFEFTIKFINDNQFTIRLNGSTIYDDGSWYKTDYINKRDNIESIVTKLHDDIVTIWKDNQTTIPIFKFEY